MRNRVRTAHLAITYVMSCHVMQCHVIVTSTSSRVVLVVTVILIVSYLVSLSMSLCDHHLSTGWSDVL